MSNKPLTTLSPDDIRTRMGTHFSTVTLDDNEAYDANVKELEVICGGKIQPYGILNKHVLNSVFNYYHHLPSVHEDFGPKDKLNEWSHQKVTKGEAMDDIYQKAVEAVKNLKVERLLLHPKSFTFLRILNAFHLLPPQASERLKVIQRLVKHFETHKFSWLPVKVIPITERKIEADIPKVGDTFWIGGVNYNNPFVNEVKVASLNFYDGFSDEADQLTWNASLEVVDTKDAPCTGLQLSQKAFNTSTDDGNSFEADLYGFTIFKHKEDAVKHVQAIVDKTIAKLSKFKSDN